MSAILEVAEGWTEELAFVAQIERQPRVIVNGEPVMDGFSLDGYDVALILKDKTGDLVNTHNKLRVDSDQTANPGKVYFAPDAGDLLASGSPYSMRLAVTDGGGQVAFFPHSRADEIVVWKP